jgi:hypothetical protein
MRVWCKQLEDVKERFPNYSFAMPLAAFISFGFITLFMGYVFPILNPRLGNPAQLLPYPSAMQKDSNIWLSIFPEKDNLVIITVDQKRFSWPLNAPDDKSVAAFKSHIQEMIKKEMLRSGLSFKATSTDTSAVLSIDQRLRYAHILPILYVFGQSKIATYGFETTLIK